MSVSTDEINTQFLGRLNEHGCSRPGPPHELQGYLQPGRPGTLGRLGRYDVLEVLGQGGFGIVVKGLDPALQRFVAIKIMLPRLAVASSPRKYFLREARSAAKVGHENVVQIHGVEEEPLPYLVMEYIEGETLQARIDRTGPLEPDEVIGIGRQVALGLAAAHARGLIHRDIKPANILIEKGDPLRVKITDFGIARTADDASLSQSGVIVGTPMYMSPEQARGEPADPRADLFSLGSVLYTMASGRPPFRAPTTMAVLRRVVEDEPRPLRQVNPALGRNLCAVIARLQAKSPAARYDSAAEVARALQDCSTGGGPPRARSRVLAWALAAAAATLAIAGIVASNPGSFVGPNDAEEPAVVAVPTANPPAAPAARPRVSPEVAWENAVAAMPADRQAPAVNAELRATNPGYDDSGATCTIKDGVVDSLTLCSPHLADLRPLRALKGLRELQLYSNSIRGGVRESLVKDLTPLRGMNLEALTICNSSVEDLSPLAGMPLKRLIVWDFRGGDLSPLKGMQLTFLNCGCSKARDLEPLRGMPLTFLCVNNSEVADLSPLTGMKLTKLLLNHTQVTDLSPILDMPLESLDVRGLAVPAGEVHRVRALSLKHLDLDYEPARDLRLLRSIATLEKVNEQPLADFLAGKGK